MKQKIEVLNPDYMLAPEAEKSSSSSYQVINPDYEIVERGALPNVLEPKTFKDTLMQMIQSQAAAATDPNSAESAFTRAAGRAAVGGALNAIQAPWNFFNKLSGQAPEDLSKNIPSFLQPTAADIQHPWAVPAGTIAGFAAPGGLLNKGIEAIPVLGELLSTEGSGILGRLLKNSIKGSAIGAAVSPEGERLKGATIGAGVAPIAAEAPGFLGTMKDLYGRTKNAFNIGALEKESQLAAQGDVQAAENLQEYHEEAKSQEQKAKEALQQHLGQEETHGVPLAAEINKSDAANVAQAKNLYNKIDESLSGKNVILSNPKDAQSIFKEIGQLVEKTKDYGSPEVQRLTQEWEAAKNQNPQTMTAKDLLTQYRTARDIAGETWQDTSNPALKEDERLALRERAKQLDEKTDELKKLLDSHMDDNEKAMMEEANTIYRDKIKPLRENSIFYQANRQGNVKYKAITSLAGPESAEEAGRSLTNEMKAKKVLRDMIKENPEANRLAIGQIFAGNPEKIHIPSNEAASYIERSPEIQQLKQNHAETMAETERAKNAIEQSKSNEKRIEVGLEPHELEQKASDEVDRLTKLSNEKNISLQEKLKRTKALEKAKKDLKTIRNTAIVAGATATGFGANSILKNLGVY